MTLKIQNRRLTTSQVDVRRVTEISTKKRSEKLALGNFTRFPELGIGQIELN